MDSKGELSAMLLAMETLVSGARLADQDREGALALARSAREWMSEQAEDAPQSLFADRMKQFKEAIALDYPKVNVMLRRPPAKLSIAAKSTSLSLGLDATPKRRSSLAAVPAPKGGHRKSSKVPEVKRVASPLGLCESQDDIVVGTSKGSRISRNSALFPPFIPSTPNDDAPGSPMKPKRTDTDKDKHKEKEKEKDKERKKQGSRVKRKQKRIGRSTSADASGVESDLAGESVESELDEAHTPNVESSEDVDLGDAVKGSPMAGKVQRIMSLGSRNSSSGSLKIAGTRKLSDKTQTITEEELKASSEKLRRKHPTDELEIVSTDEDMSDSAKLARRFSRSQELEKDKKKVARRDSVTRVKSKSKAMTNIPIPPSSRYAMSDPPELHSCTSVSECGSGTDSPRPEGSSSLVIEDGKVTAATVDAMLECLYSHVIGIKDIQLIESFVLTYSYFTDTHSLLEKLFNVLEKEARGEQRSQSGATSPRPDVTVSLQQQLRIVNIFKKWLKLNGYLLREKADLMDYFEKRLTVLESINSNAEKWVKRLRDAFPNTPPPSDALSALASSPTVLCNSRKKDNAPSIATSLTLSIFHSMEAARIARQLTFNMFKVFADIPPYEFLHKRFTNPAQAPFYHQFVDEFNNTSMWVGSIIMHVATPKHRTAAVTKFIEIAQAFRELNNFAGLAAIVAGLESTAVSRLKTLWRSIDDAHMRDLTALKEQVSPADNYTTYRQTIEKASLPQLPFVAVHTKDLIFLEEMPTILDNELINFHKCRNIGEKVFRIFNCQKCRYTITSEKAAANFLSHSFHPNFLLSEDTLYAHSLEIEPLACGMSKDDMDSLPMIRKPSRTAADRTGGSGSGIGGTSSIMRVEFLSVVDYAKHLRGMTVEAVNKALQVSQAGGDGEETRKQLQLASHYLTELTAMEDKMTRLAKAL